MCGHARRLPNMHWAAQEPIVLLEKDFATKANKPEQTVQVKGAQPEVVAHYTAQGNHAHAHTKVVQDQLWYDHSTAWV